jgi:hypothetical protein
MQPAAAQEKKVLTQEGHSIVTPVLLQSMAFEGRRSKIQGKIIYVAGNAVD